MKKQEMERVSILEAVRLWKAGKHVVHFRPEPELPEETQYALVIKTEDIYD